MDYYRILEGFDDAGIDYLVVGGLAVNLHGIPRMTYDLDLMVGLNPENVSRAVRLLSGWGYRPGVPVDPLDLAREDVRASWRAEKEMRALAFIHGDAAMGEIDLVFDAAGKYRQLRDNAKLVPIGKLSVPVIGRRDLISMKQASERAQDRDDAEALREFGEEP